MGRFGGGVDWSGDTDDGNGERHDLGGHVMTVLQHAAVQTDVCEASVTPDRIEAPAEGRTARINVTGTGKFCGWTATTDDTFLRITSTMPQVGDDA